MLCFGQGSDHFDKHKDFAYTSQSHSNVLELESLHSNIIHPHAALWFQNFLYWGEDYPIIPGQILRRSVMKREVHRRSEWVWDKA